MEAAEGVCQPLRNALKKAIGKCGSKLQKETKEACDKYLTLLGKFEDDLAERSKAITNEIASIMEAFDKLLKTTIPTATKQLQIVHSSDLSGYAKEFKKLEKLASQSLDKPQTEKLAKNLLATVKGLGKLESHARKIHEKVDVVLVECDEKIVSARKDPRYRPAIAELQKKVDAYETMKDKVIDDTYKP